MYVGQSVNLRTRWIGHDRSEECLDECGDFRIAWIENPWRGFIRFEKLAIEKYLPKFNRKLR